jgi:hypothetical protein
MSEQLRMFLVNLNRWPGPDSDPRHRVQRARLRGLGAGPRAPMLQQVFANVCELLQEWLRPLPLRPGLRTSGLLGRLPGGAAARRGRVRLPEGAGAELRFVLVPRAASGPRAHPGPAAAPGTAGHLLQFSMQRDVAVWAGGLHAFQGFLYFTMILLVHWSQSPRAFYAFSLLLFTGNGFSFFLFIRHYGCAILPPLLLLLPTNRVLLLIIITRHGSYSLKLSRAFQADLMTLNSSIQGKSERSTVFIILSPYIIHGLLIQRGR